MDIGIKRQLSVAAETWGAAGDWIHPRPFCMAMYMAGLDMKTGAGKETELRTLWEGVLGGDTFTRGDWWGLRLRGW